MKVFSLSTRAACGIMAIFALTLLLPSASPRPVQQAQPWSEKGASLVIWSERLALRDTPSSQGNILTLLSEGEAVIFLDETSDTAGKVSEIPTSWMKVAVTGGLTGWVQRKGVKFGAVVSPGWGGAADTVAQAVEDYAVYLCSGEYHESLNIKGKKGLHIKGGNGVILTTDSPDTPAIAIENSSGIVLENLRAANLSGDIVSVKNSQEVSIIRCDLDGAGKTCLRAEKSSYLLLAGSRLHQASLGCLSFTRCFELRITKNIIYSNGVAKKSTPADTCGGSVIFMAGCAYAVFRENTVTKNYGLSPAVISKSKGIAMAENIFFMNCGEPDFAAMKVAEHANWTKDPLFADPDTDDFRLRADSPLADKGKAKAGALGITP